MQKANWEREFEAFKKDIKLKMEDMKSTGIYEGDEEGRGKIQELEKVAEEWRREKIRENIIIAGKEFDGDNLKTEVTVWIEEKFDEVTEIKEARRLRDGRILVRLGSMKDKIKIMKKRKNLKGTRIYIDDDLTKKERWIQKKIKERSDKERAEGKKTKIKYKKLIINGSEWRWNEKKSTLFQRQQENEGGGEN